MPGRGVMEAIARIVADTDVVGRTRLVVLRSEPPLVLRRTGPRIAGPGAGPTEVHVVGGAAGPLGGDRLHLEIHVRPGAHLRVRTVAATLALPGPGGLASRTSVHASVAGRGRLEWLPEPVIAGRGCHHLSCSTVELSAEAQLTWREEVICGRHAEECGDLRTVTVVRLDGRPLLHQELAVGPSATGWAGPAVLGAHRAAGSVLVVDPAWRTGAQSPMVGSQASPQSPMVGSQASPQSPMVGSQASPTLAAVVGADAALMPLAGPAVLASAVASDAHELRKALTLLVGGLARCRVADTV